MVRLLSYIAFLVEIQQSEYLWKTTDHGDSVRQSDPSDMILYLE